MLDAMNSDAGYFANESSVPSTPYINNNNNNNASIKQRRLKHIELTSWHLNDSRCAWSHLWNRRVHEHHSTSSLKSNWITCKINGQKKYLPCKLFHDSLIHHRNDVINDLARITTMELSSWCCTAVGRTVAVWRGVSSYCGPAKCKRRSSATNKLRGVGLALSHNDNIIFIFSFLPFFGRRLGVRSQTVTRVSHLYFVAHAAKSFERGNFTVGKSEITLRAIFFTGSQNSADCS